MSADGIFGTNIKLKRAIPVVNLCYIVRNLVLPPLGLFFLTKIFMWKKKNNKTQFRLESEPFCEAQIPIVGEDSWIDLNHILHHLKVMSFGINRRIYADHY